jgi:NADPH:quinone reductase-like Zn-dependent oxidoreductase
MKAIRIEEYGGPETLRVGNLELPDPGPGEVRVKLRAAGLNFVDVYLRRGDVCAAGPNFARTREELLHRADAVLNGIREGWLRLHIDRVFPLAEAVEAQRRLENRESTGKIILQTAA